MASTVGLNKVFILDKYFAELNKFWLKNSQESQNNNNNNNNNNNHSSLQHQQHTFGPLEHNATPLFNYPITNIQNFCNAIQNNGAFHNALLDINDLIHLDGPITE